MKVPQVNDSATDPLKQLQNTFGQPLYAAGLRLVDNNFVSDVRVLQAGATVTGVARDDATADAPKHRVYIQFKHAADPQAGIDGECSCGERSPCAHIAAVSIAVTKGSSSQSPPGPQTSTSAAVSIASAHTSSTATQHQQLRYLLKKPTAANLANHLELSVWVAQPAPGTGRIQSQAALPFVPRPDRHSEYPRYVDTQDRGILKMLLMQRPNGPWDLRSAEGATLLQQAVATGRAHWESLETQMLRTGQPRAVPFAWELLPNGDQRLGCEAPESIEVILSMDPAMYVDTRGCECGEIALPCSPYLMRQCWDRPDVTPEHVESLNEQIAHAGAEGLPRLRSISVQRQALAGLQPRLLLSAGPEAALLFNYNGAFVDPRTLRPEQNSVRICLGECVYAIDRDRSAERRFHLQLSKLLGVGVRDRAFWLKFMLDTVPLIEAEGWEIVVDRKFPYRLATAGNWYGDLEADARAARRSQSGNTRSAQHEWFNLRLGIMVDGHPVNLLPALTAYLQESFDKNDPSCCRVGETLFVSMEDGRYVPVPMDRVQRIAETLVELFDRNCLNRQLALTLPANQASRIAQLVPELGGPQDSSLRSDDSALLARMQDLKQFSGIEPLPAPAQFRTTLRPYQQEGLGWLQFLRRYGLGGILADDMGLGKTAQALAHLTLELEQGRLNGPSLIVAPVSVIGNWQQEIRRFMPEFNTLILHGAKRRELFHAVEAADLVITGYPALVLDSEFLLAQSFNFLILDEAQTIKNPRAKVSQVARALRATHRLCLTGTPTENHLGELWSLFDFLQPGLLGSEKEFQRHYRTPIEKNADAKRSAALTRRIAPFVLRRTKDAVARDLPPKTQIVEHIVLDEKQRDFYDGIRMTMHRRVQEIIEQQALARSQITVLDALLKLRQACCDPRLVDSQAATQLIPSAKLEWLKTVLPELVAEGRRILLFSQFTSMLKLIEEVVRKLSIPYCLLTGASQNRSELVARFQNGSVPLFLVSLKAGGTGLNLTAADTVIHYDPWWNPAVEAQATDRAHRIGQDKPVFVYKLIALSTVEEKIMQLQADKQALLNQLYSETTAAPTRLNAEDLEALFAP